MDAHIDSRHNALLLTVQDREGCQAGPCREL